MKRTTIVLPENLLTWLNQEADREDRSLAGEIRFKLESIRKGGRKNKKRQNAY